MSAVVVSADRVVANGTTANKTENRTVSAEVERKSRIVEWK